MAALQLLINAPELVGALQLIGGNAKPSQHKNEQQPMPELDAPADRVENHGYPSMQ
jgi:hypothetical protein